MVFFDTGSLATVVHQARTCPADKLTAVSLQPGKLLTVARRVERLPSPYKSHCSDYIARGVYPAFEGYLNYDRVEVLGYLSGYLGIWLGLSLSTLAFQAQKRFCPSQCRSLTKRK
ncbi:hypothetical protein HPB52_003273 [Rhipicephalus sanguineus]|uniref:Uncharacterized protein n=1 Tax=Rhipicephalus sanguineus TaxID=34632 RepID=A0A9D4QFU2_RHISA|nr:hypothetical protein HPB52_003273 [Rhipicephalus sanguineus]